MYKLGDDVRQDQLVLQIMGVMDFVLKQINLDFKFSIYNVLAHSESDGMLEFVPNCCTIQDILKHNKPKSSSETHIGLYLKSSCYKNGYDYKGVFETYLDSCAGYAVVTYLLAVGDRHLENLLIDEKGHFFHCDFGFIFGKNPAGKNLWPPPIRICKEMITCMGGFESAYYKRFVDKCVDAFKYLRNHSKYILNLLHLMIHAGIGDLPADQSEKILTKMYEKFLPHIRDQEEVEKEFAGFIKESVNAFFVKVMEKFHVWAGAFK
mmetsp:Transcript_22004/g.21726  ORF Transcript_22004/g.21726 Transcript_22004/m.21726 type:complete len:264 (-) Transcript_22004:21-812(-)